MRRLTQQYGFTYDFGNKQLRTNQSEYVPFPQEFDFVLERIQTYFGDLKIQNMIINEYRGSQGISRHLDRSDYFGNVVVSLSLLAPAPFFFYEFEHVDPITVTGKRGENSVKRVQTGRIAKMILEANSLLVLADEARYDWQHEIPKLNPIKHKDFDENYAGTKKWFKREEDYRRVSLTFRCVLQDIINTD
jgi:alkylated DNA repair protein alkB family protein 8